MLLRGKKVTELLNADILSLIDDQIPESLTLDYKRDFKLKDDGEKSEFLADITAFHNTEGGIIIFGLEDEKNENNQNTGIPKLPSENGVLIDNYDNEKNKIEEIVRNSTDPQLNHLAFSELLVVNGCKVFAISIPKNLSLPTRVSFRKSSKFYRRGNAGKYLLGTHELYSLFIKNMEIREKAKEFIYSRINEVRNNHFWDNIGLVPGILIHIIPLSNMGNSTLEFLPSTAQNDMIQMLSPIMSEGYNYNHCFEGFIIHSHPYNDLYSYNLIFRDGSIEIFTTGVFSQDGSGYYSLSGELLASCLLEQLKKAFVYFSTIEVEGPFCISLALNNLEGVPFSGSYRQRKSFRTPNIQFPVIVIQSFEQDFKKAIASMFHVIWQSAGYEMCPSDILQKI
ncbi:AlbA family DNA-binding domain-containing protein [Chitinophaga niabensis]|uniref:Putative DNA-binding domain-containing protein n=1 Tax=Chitinophaga niabensis TaxID=536979 RepID=A0A1N6ERW1_9BACT|nr:ATP-binding protein [Chitinophaga niabensis]SIN85684.1 Putative DNA-binding domain-containing protein [Chitinophaga niabensis]